MTLGEKIRQLRKGKGLSQEEFSRQTGIHPKHIGRYEANKNIPSADKLKRIAETLEVSADYLLFNNVPRDGKKEISDLPLFEMFKSVEIMDEKDKETIKNLISAMIAKRKMEEVLSKP